MKRLACALLLASTCAWGQTFEELVRQAEGGDGQAQFRVGSAYETGRGVGRDRAEAEKWYLRSAESGYAEAQNTMGSLLQERKQYGEAIAWYEKATAQGHALGTHNLGYLYDLGLGVPQDRRKGFELYTRAADLGWAESMWNLANMHGAGQLGTVDLVAACIWTLRARRFARADERVLLSRSGSVVTRLEKMLPADQMAKCKQEAYDWQPKARPGTK